MRVVNTDNHGGDYPNEKFMSLCEECRSGHPKEEFPDGTALHIHGATAVTCTDRPMTMKEAQALADKLNEGVQDYSSRYHIVVKDDYKLVPGFEP